ncbi:MAG TPA: hypothetical protein VIP28_10375 [Nocardioides sp.]
MAAFFAHLALFGRHRRTAVVGGYHWRYCHHRSHRLRLRCWRWFIHDGYCARHNNSCWGNCPTGVGP